MVDIRDEERVAEAVRETADKFGGIRADRHPPSSAALGPPMAPITSGTTTRGAAH
jgi:hypothetical protein